MRNSWFDDVSGSSWPTGVQLSLKAKTHRGAQGEVQLPALTLSPQQRVTLMLPPDGLTIPRKGILNCPAARVQGCQFSTGHSAAADERIAQTLVRALGISSAVLVQRRTRSRSLVPRKGYDSCRTSG